MLLFPLFTLPSFLLFAPAAQSQTLFVVVDRVDHGQTTLLSARWEDVDGGLLAAEIGPLVAPMRAQLDLAALRLADAPVGEAITLKTRQGGTRLVVRLEQRPDPLAHFEELWLAELDDE